MRHGSSLLCSLVLLCAAPAQDAVGPTAPARRGLPGRIPGTERWLLTFKERSFDLTAYREAIRSRRPAAEVTALVTDLERRVSEDQAPFAAWIVAQGGRVVAQWWIVNGCAVEVPPALIPVLRMLPVIDCLHPDEEIHPLAATVPGMIRTATNGANHDSDAANAAGFRGAGVTTAIVDTGLDHNYAGAPNIPHATFYKNGDKNNHTGPGLDGSRLLACHQLGRVSCDDRNDHGTGVASIAAGEKWSASANSDRGHAPDANVIGYSIANDAGGSADLTTITNAWNAVARDRAAHNIVTANNSYSGTPDPTNVSQQALDSCALNADVLVCVAAGNSGGSTLGSQAAVNGLSVGATNPTAKTVAGFSARGPIAGARFYPDVAACGVHTVMAQRDDESSQYVTSGTSMAAPQVCGAGTVFRAIRNNTALETKAALLASTEDISAQNQGLDRNSFGMGFLRTDQVVRALPFEDTIATTGTPKTYPFPVTFGKGYAVAVTWFRTRLGLATWSNLDLRVLDGATVVATSSTPFNLYEKVVFVAARTGSFTIEVSAASLDAPSVRFALCPMEIPPPRIEGAYTTYGAGCAGSGLGGGGPVCLRRNDDMTLANAIGSATRFALLVNSGANNVLVSGFELWCKTASGTPAPMTCWVYDRSAGGQPGNVLTTGTMNVSGAPAWNRVLLSPAAIAPNTDFFLVFDNRTGLTMPVASSGSPVVNYFGGPTTWSGPVTTTPWNYRVNCGGSGSGAVPLLTNVGAPEIGQAFDAKLSFARANAPALFLIGTSRTNWSGVPLPFDLTSVGAPACFVSAAGLVMLTAAADALGAATVNLALPNDKALIQARFYNQFVVVDPQANALGIATTRGGEGLIGGQH